MKFKKTKILTAAAFTLLFAVFLFQYLTSKLWDYDFWWHLATGRYIVEHRSLPQHDPFCFTSGLPENRNPNPVREAFILKQYWLAQVIFYLLYANLGSKGIILLKTAIILSVLCLFLYALYKRRVKFYISFIFTFLVYRCIYPFSGERPVLFTILFSVAAFVLLDDYKRNRGWKLVFLIPLMMLWANLHGGFVLGDVIIIAFMAGEMISMIRHSAYTYREMKMFLLVSAAAIAASFVNPGGITAFFIAFSSKYNFFTKYVQEYQPPFPLYMKKLYPVEYAYIALVFLFPLVLAMKGKKFDITYLIITAGLWYEGLASMRFTIYYVVIGGIILATILSDIVDELFAKRFSAGMKDKMERVFAVVLLLSSLSFAAAFLKIQKPQFREASIFFVPVNGVDFIQKNGIKGRIFNEFGAGGYLDWRLYPEKRTFIDSRAINAIQLQEYPFIAEGYHSLKSRDEPVETGEKEDQKKTELWDRMLDHYNVNVIFLTPLDIYGTIAKLTFKLAKSDKWVLVHNDLLSIVYVRNCEANRDIIDKYKMPNDAAFNTVVIQAALKARGSDNPTFMASLGKTFYYLGRLEDALKAYKYSYAIKSNPEVLGKINRIEKEIKQKKDKESQGVSKKKIKT